MGTRKKIFHCSFWKSYAWKYRVVIHQLIMFYMTIWWAVCFWSQVWIDVVSSHNFHFSVGFLLYAERMQFCSFVTEFYQAFTKYSLQCIKQIPYGPRNIESPTGFLQVYPNSIFPFLFRTSSFCRLPILFAVELSNNPPPKINTILINSEKPSGMTLLSFIENSFSFLQKFSARISSLKASTFLSTSELSPKCTHNVNKSW